MRSTIDAAGRLVIPKVLRDGLGLRSGVVVELRECGGRMEVEVVQTPMRLAETELGLVAVADVDMPTLTDDVVRETLERHRW